MQKLMPQIPENEKIILLFLSSFFGRF